MTNGQETYTHLLARRSVSQIIYAQAERQYRHQTNAAQTSSRQHRPVKPLSAGSINTTETFPSALAEILQMHIEKLGHISLKYCELSGRSTPTLVDIIQAIGPKIRDLVRYAMYEEITFPHTISPFPVLPTRIEKKDVQELTTGRENRLYIDAWMPALPPAHTFMDTVVYGTTGKKMEEEGREKGKRDVQASLARLREAKVRRQGLNDAANAAAQAAAPGNPFVKVPCVGEGEVFEDVAGEPRDVLERDIVEGIKEDKIDVGMSNDLELKRKRVERVLKESGGASISMNYVEEKDKEKGKDATAAVEQSGK